MSSPVWNRVYTLDVGEICYDSCSVKTSAAPGFTDLLRLSDPFLVLPQSKQASAAALAGGGGGGNGVRGVGGVGGEAVVPCEAVERGAQAGRAVALGGDWKKRSFDVALGDVGGVANVGEAGVVGSWWLAYDMSLKRVT
jgi:hypothetical protein